MFGFRKPRYYRLIVCLNDKTVYNLFKENYFDILKGVDKDVSVFELSVKDISFIYLKTAKKIDLKKINSSLVIYGAYLIESSKKESNFDFLMTQKYGKIINY